MKIVIIGQSVFARDVYSGLKEDGHEIVGVYTVPDQNNREDALATVAAKDNVPVFKLSRWRVKGKPIPEVFEQYKQLNADLNVLPFCTQFIPMEVIEYPKHQSIIYHPSLLPKHRGASSINWTLIQGDTKSGFTVFWADDGLDEGPILLQKECDVGINDTVESLYNRFLFPAGVEGVREAVDLIAKGRAPRLPQPAEGASYEPILNKNELTFLKWNQLTGTQVHNFIRGMDKVPGATIILNGEQVKLYSSSIMYDPLPSSPFSRTEVTVEGMSRSGLVTSRGLVLFGNDDRPVLVKKIQRSFGKMINASQYGADDVSREIEFDEQEKQFVNDVRSVWMAILKTDVESDTDFFKSGAGSMDVTRLVAEVAEVCDVQLENEDVYMNTRFEEFSKAVILRSRGEGSTPGFCL